MAGQILDNAGIIAALQSGDIAIEGWDGTKFFPLTAPVLANLTPSDTVQPASLDLTIGNIYAPPREPFPEGQTPKLQKQTGHSLRPGETVIIYTREKIKLASNIGAFGFPPASLATNSILMTNPGHVDPGYEGNLRFTIINMRRVPFELVSGEKLVTLMLVDFGTKEASRDYSTLMANAGSRSDLAEVLNNLAPDFADFERRAELAAKDAVIEQTKVFDTQVQDAKAQQDRAENSFGPKAIFSTLGAGLVVAMLTYSSNFLGYAKEDSVEALADKFDQAERTKVSKSSVDTLSDRLADLEQNAVPGDLIESLDARVEKLEGEDLLRSLDTRLKELEDTLRELEPPE